RRGGVVTETVTGSRAQDAARLKVASRRGSRRAARRSTRLRVFPAAVCSGAPIRQVRHSPYSDAPMAISGATAGSLIQPDRIPSLDGFRAISIGLVLFGHLLGTSGFFLTLDFNKHLAIGELGVRVFFVISGFLITNLLLTEAAATGRIHIGRFYLRRTFRIFPPYYVFILAAALAAMAPWIELNPGDLFSTLTYTSNSHVTRSWNVCHTWSLAVEEQFYLLWPALLVLLGGRRAVWLAALFVFAAPLIRLGLWELTVSARDGVGNRFETVADSIAVGC